MNILITGGASGLGHAITSLLAGKPNYKVFFTYSQSALQAKELEKKFNNATAICCDFTNIDHIKSLCESIKNLHLDVLINNAYTGKFLDNYFHKTPSADYLENFKNNLLPTIEITQSVLSEFRKKKTGKIITILTSALHETPPMGASVYLAGKAYLEKLVKIWASENSKFNITSIAVSPSFMLTGLTSKMDERIIQQIVEQHPLKKLLSPEEVAQTILSLITDQNHINGENIIMNAATGTH